MFPVVWKPDVGEKGNDIRFIRDRKELQNQVADFLLHKKYNQVLIDEYIDEPEYRIYYALGKVYFLYKRVRPKVMGDGKSSLNSLINEKRLQAAEIVKRQTAAFLGVDLDWTPEQGQSINLLVPANLSRGGEMEDYTAQPLPSIERWARKICEAINLDICGFDVFIQNYGTDAMKIKVIELNFNPGLIGIYISGRKETAYRIWRDILKYYFAG